MGRKKKHPARHGWRKRKSEECEEAVAEKERLQANISNLVSKKVTWRKDVGKARKTCGEHGDDVRQNKKPGTK
jgi:hypothetical protein